MSDILLSSIPAAQPLTDAGAPAALSHGSPGLVRILYVIGTLNTGGAERQLLELLRRIDRSRFSVSLAMFTRSGHELALGLVDHILDLDIPSSEGRRWNARVFCSARAVQRLVRFIRRHRIQIVHPILPGACMVGCPAGKLAGAPIVAGSRRSLAAPYRDVSRLKAAMDRVALLFSDYMLGNSRAVTDELTWLDGFSRTRSLTIYNGVDTGRFSPAADRSLRDELGFNDSHVVLGTVANFFAYKRHVDLVRAAALLCRDFPQARFLVVGEDRGTLPEVRHAIHEAGLDGRFILIPGSEEPERVFAAMDVYLCTSETEGFSNVLLEAMASGKPVVATDVGGNREALGDGAGVMVPVCDPPALARAVSRLLSSAELRQTMGKTARERAAQLFSMEAMVHSYEEFYLDAVRRIA